MISAAGSCSRSANPSCSLRLVLEARSRVGSNSSSHPFLSPSSSKETTPASLDGVVSLLEEGERNGWEEEFDPTLLLASKTSLREQLGLALREQLPAADIMVIDYLVGNLDEDGYLRTTMQEAAQVCEVSPEHVERVLATLQAQEPPGVG